MAGALTLTGCGSDHSNPVARPSDRTVDVTMTDNAFEPTSLEVTNGDTVTFAFTNTGTARHEAIIGDDAAQAAHHDEMGQAAEDDGHDDDHGGSTGAAAITVEPGATGEIVHTFDESGTVLIGCHEPGHWEAGMKATITVT